MKLYHGTNEDFSQIELGKSKSGKDFGIGFYLTPEKAIATRQAMRKFAQLGTGGHFVKEYEWDEESKNLKILRFGGYTQEWANFILMNRKNKTRTQKHDFDVVIGPIADDTVGFQIRRFEDGIINMSQFLEEIKYSHITIQYLFATEKALKTLHSI